MCFIDESIAIAKESPPTGRYKVVNLEKYKNRTEKWQIYKDKKMGERMAKLPKLNMPSPDTYKPEQSFKKAVDPKNDKFFKIKKFKEKCFVDTYVGQHNYVPSPSQYNHLEAFKNTSMSPVLRKKRC